jgi:hypothetical protein
LRREPNPASLPDCQKITFGKLGGWNLTIFLMLSGYEEDAQYFGKESRSDDLDRHGDIYVWGNDLRPVGA